DPDKRRAGNALDVAQARLDRAHEVELVDVDLDAVGDDDVDAAHDRGGIDRDDAAVDLGLAEVDLAAAHQRERVELVARPPAPGAAGPAHDADDVVRDLAPLGLGDGRPSQYGQVDDHLVELGA